MPLPDLAAVREVLRPVQADAAVAAALAEAGALIADFAGPEYTGAEPLVATWRITGRRGYETIHFPHMATRVDQVSVNGLVQTSDRFELDGYGLRNYYGYWHGVVQAVYHPVPDGAVRYQVALDLVNHRLSWTPYASVSVPGGPSVSMGSDWHSQVKRILARLSQGMSPMVLPDQIVTHPGAPVVHTDALYVGTLAAADGAVDLSALTPGVRIPVFTGNRYVFVATPSGRPLLRLYIGGGALDILPTFVRRREVDMVDGVDYDAWVSGVPYAGDIAGGLSVTVGR